MTNLARLISVLLGQRAHAQIVIVVKDGQLQPVHVNQTFLPGELPKV
ncbi:MAG TPA: hypothetical protein VGY48_15155 [Vicinamibacterales bacterium]|nr:hypothetical protein [Vicinamibacterales bacterium]